MRGMGLSIKERLADITTVELIDELTGRMETAVFIGTKPLEDGMNTFWESYGRDDFCYGLCAQMMFKLKERMTERVMKGESDA